jgi:formate dehydrogenase subunit gamma
MSSISVTALPQALTPEQAREMAQSQIKKHVVAVVLLHWFNAFVWLLELATGAALIVSPSLRFMPAWYLTMMEQLFGSRANLLRFHIAVGMMWIFVCLVYVTFGWRHFLHAEVLAKEVALDRDDFAWLKMRSLSLLKKSEAPLPPQGAYNAGQKLYALMIYTCIPLIMLSGLVMSFHLFGTAAVQWAMVIHFLLVGMVVSGLMIHVYMGAVFPEERPAFYSMITGMVDELYAYRHHFKWWADVKRQQQEWEESLEPAEGVSPGTKPAQLPKMES